MDTAETQEETLATQEATDEAIPEAGPSTTQTPNDDTPEAASAPAQKKRERKPPTAYARPLGTSPLPIARVQKILKADEELVMVQREAVLAIAIATEQFVKRLMEAVHRVAQRERRTTVQQRDMLSVVRRADEFLFLDEIVQTVVPSEPPAKRKPKALEKQKRPTTTLLDQFVGGKQDEEGGPEEDIVMNDDGTMTLRQS